MDLLSPMNVEEEPLKELEPDREPFSAMARLITLMQEFCSAFAHPFTWQWWRNPYACFGILWGTPIPVVVFVAVLWAQEKALTLSAVSDLLSDHPWLWIFPLHPVIFAFVFGALGTVRHRKNKEIFSLMENLRKEARTDALTGLSNRRLLLESCPRELERCRRLNRPLSLIMFDLDHFKSINDNHGHDAGDAVLKHVARIFKECSRRYDFVFRWGGEEFVTLLPECDLAVAQDYAERARHTLEQSPCAYGGQNISLTLSAGVSQAGPSETGEALIMRTDEALLKAKEKGRNRVVVA